MRVLLIDNYDSFTWNLAQALGGRGADVTVLRNDATTAVEALSGGWDRIVISPGPGRPVEAGMSLDIIRAAFHRNISLLGVCLGHQAIAEACGARIGSATELVHGRTSPISHDGRTIFHGLPDPFEATRYHSLAVEETRFPDCLEISARAPDGTIMGLRHRALPVEGVQFHPESILTPWGERLIENFLRKGVALPVAAANGRIS